MSYVFEIIAFFLPSPCNLNVVFVKFKIFKFCKLPRSEADAQDTKRSSEGTRSSANNQIPCETHQLQDTAGNARASTLSYARLKPGTRVRAGRKQFEKILPTKNVTSGKKFWLKLANSTLPLTTPAQGSLRVGFCISDLSNRWPIRLHATRSLSRRTRAPEVKNFAHPENCL